NLETLVGKVRPTQDQNPLWKRLIGTAKSVTGNSFRNAVKAACDEVKQTPPIPSIDDLRAQFFAKGGWPAVVQEQLHHVRSFLTHELAKKMDGLLDQIVDNVLKELLDGLLASPLDRLLPTQSHGDADPRRRISAFRELLSSARQPGLVSALDYAL